MFSSYSSQWTPDVFVSFKGREPFIKNLFEGLKKAGIGCIEEAKDLDKAICQARFALIVFSANYVNSRSCLDELVKILLRRGYSKYPSLVVIPIFHGMDPANDPALREKGEFIPALDKLQGKEKDEKKKEWSHALAEVEGIWCYELQKDANDSVVLELVNKIVERLVNEIRSLYSHKVFGPFGTRGKTSWHSDKIEGIDVKYTEFIKSLTFKVPKNTGHNPITTKDTYKIKLTEDEGIISFSGYFDKPEYPRGIQALEFLTTSKTLRVGRPVDGRKADFSVPLPPDAVKAIEFFGSKNRDGFLTSIGARVELKRVDLPPELSCPAGLFGSTRGEKWDDKQQTPVKGIRAVSGDRCIRSIAFLFDDGAWRSHGSDTQKTTVSQLIIKDRDEYLSSISGYHSYDGITSLTFLTSKKCTITFGDGKGTHFSSPKTGYKIVGFYGWSDKHLHGIGAYFEPISDLHPMKSIGPFGGEIAWDDGKFKGVKKIYINKGGDIRCIKIVYDDNSDKGCTIIHGDYTGEFSDKTVDLKYPHKYLTSISGYTQDNGSIETLIFHSNRDKVLFGRRKGKKYFGYSSNKSRIVGFYGTYCKTLNSIGVYEEPITDWKPVENKASRGFVRPSESEENYWNDGEHSGVVGYRVTEVRKSMTEVRKSKQTAKIESITFMYENNGSLVEGSPRGGGDPSTGVWVMLDYPKERLDRIRGYHCKDDAGETIIHDLKIVTSSDRKTYAKRGEPDSDDETDQKKEDLDNESKSRRFTILERLEVGRRIIGFFGKAKTCLNFIGAHLEP